MGKPKALLREDTGALFAARAMSVLREGGCTRVVVVVGAQSDEVSEQLGAELGGDDQIVEAVDWDEGMGASLRTGLRAIADTEADCAVVSLVDLPDVGASVVRRLLATLGCGSEVLGRASYDAVPGHPVLIGAGHWAGVVDVARGDRGARDYLSDRHPILVECGDLASGLDVDTPDQLS